MPKSSEKHPPESEGGGKKGRRPGAPCAAAQSPRMNVAFPFSQIKLSEPSRELTDLAAVVLDLVTAMAEWVPEDRLEDLRSRAQSVYDSLR